MILHITFSDGSNPLFSYPSNRHAAAKQWRQWMKYHPLTAQPKIYNGDYMAEMSGDRAGYHVWERGRYFATVRKYKHLGHALAALERLGGEKA